MQESQASRINIEQDAIFKALQAKKGYITLKEQLFQKLQESQVPLGDWPAQIARLSQNSHIESKLKQLIYDISQTIIKPEPIKYDANETINQARQAWTEFLIQNLIQLSNKLLEQLDHADPKKEVKEEKNPLRFYDSKNLYAACVSSCLLRAKRSLTNQADLKLPKRCAFDPVSIDEIKKTYAETLYDEDNLMNDEEDDEALIDEREIEAEALIQKGTLLEMEAFARKGLPNGLRIRFYRRYLGIDNQLRTNKLHKQFISIQENMKGHKYIIDEIINREQLEVLNDEKYFIFNEILNKVIWTFFRDKHVQEKLAILSILPFTTIEDINKIIPYCGVIPCVQFPKYALPFLYSSEKPEEVYFMFREFYCRYFCFLNSLSSHPNSILRLCHLFEELLYKQNPKLTSYFASSGFEPLPIVMHWMMYCFIGNLEVEQLFCLFDRIIGYNSLEVVAILAAGVILKKAEKIIKSKTRDKIEEVCYNLKDINVVECLQLILPE